MVFDRIRDVHLTFSPSKCQFAVADVDYLGHHVGLGCVQPQAAKVEAVMAYPTPINLGLAGYYRKFIPHYAHISAVLSDLLKKGVKFRWTSEADAAFLDLKSPLATRPILRPPDYSLPFCMAVDTSKLAIDASLFQVVENVSKKLNRHQKRYSTIEKEALALVLAVWLFSVYVGMQPVKVFTDHSPFQFIQRMAENNQKLLRWSLELQQYNLEIGHRAGRDNLMPDLLNRPPCFVITLNVSLPSSRFAYAFTLLYKCAFAIQFVIVFSMLCIRTILLSLFAGNLILHYSSTLSYIQY